MRDNELFSSLLPPFVVIDGRKQVHAFTSHLALSTLPNSMLDKKLMRGAEVIDATGRRIRILDAAIVQRAEPSFWRFAVQCFTGDPEFLVGYSFTLESPIALEEFQERVCAAYEAQKVSRFDRTGNAARADHLAAIRATRTIRELHQVMFPGEFDHA